MARSSPRVERAVDRPENAASTGAASPLEVASRCVRAVSARPFPGESSFVSGLRGLYRVSSVLGFQGGRFFIASPVFIFVIMAEAEVAVEILSGGRGLVARLTNGL